MMQLKKVTYEAFEKADTIRKFHEGGKYRDLREFVTNTTDGCLQVTGKDKKEISLAIMAAKATAKKAGKTLQVKYPDLVSAIIWVMPV